MKLWILMTGMILMWAVWPPAGWAATDRAVGEVSFSTLWEQIKANSPVLRAASNEVEAQRIAKWRAELHWVPTLGVEAKGYSTDDPGEVLFSKLGARGVSGMDFAPLALNFPERGMFLRMSAGLDWKLFEGGMKSALSEARQYWVEAAEGQRAVQMQRVCGESLKFYSELLTLRDEEVGLSPVSQTLNRLIDRYRIGSKSNPLGHSGLLGLQTLEKRIAGELLFIQAKKKSLYSALNEMSGLGVEWVPPEKLAFLDFTQSLLRTSASDTVAASVQAARDSAQGFHAAASAERARFLPQIGLFTQGNYSIASTTSATSLVGGAYLRWELFNPSEWLAVREARARAFAAEAQAEALAQMQRSNNVRWFEVRNTLQAQLALAEDSLKLMEEQTTIALQLFQSGVLNALQLTDVLSRRVELLVARTSMGDGLVKAQAELLASLPAEEAVCN